MQLIRRSFAIGALVLVTALAACGGSAAAGGGGGAGRPSTRAEHVQVTLTDFAIEPAATAVHQHSVLFEVANRGRTPHNLSIRDGAGRTLGHTRDLNPGQSASLSLELGDGLELAQPARFAREQPVAAFVDRRFG